MLGFAGPATVVGAAAARVHGDHELARALLGIVDAAGMPIQIGGRRRYAGGLVPLGDAFIAWARSSPLASASGADAWPLRLPRWWFVPIHLVSALVIAVICTRLRPRCR